MLAFKFVAWFHNVQLAKFRTRVLEYRCQCKYQSTKLK